MFFCKPLQNARKGCLHDCSEVHRLPSPGLIQELLEEMFCFRSASASVSAVHGYSADMFGVGTKFTGTGDLFDTKSQTW